MATDAPWVLVSAGFHQRGGQSRANAALADYLLRRNTPVHLVAHDLDECFLGLPGCTTHPVTRPFGADLLGVFGLRRRGREVARQVLARHPKARVVVNGGCCSWGDINWVHYLHSAWCWTGRLPWKARVKEAVAGYLFRGQERKALRAARLVIANSNSTRLALVNGLKLDPARVHTVYLGCEPSWHPPEASERSAGRKWLDQPEGRPLILFVGGLGHDGRKGFDVLWTAWRSLCSDPNWDADLVVAGGGAASASWEARVGREGLTGRVRLIGFTDRVFDLLAAADLLVSPARYEPYGLNVQEAVCRGVPALTSARAGVVEHYPPELGDLILPDPEDWQDLARRLRLWRADVAGWRERFRPLSGVLRDHTWDATAAHIVRLAEEGLTQSQCSPARAQDECQSLVVRHD